MAKIHPTIAEHVMEENEPVCPFCGEPSDHCNQSFPHPSKPAPAQDERGDELEAIHQYAFEVGGTEGGRYMLEPEELDEVARRACEPFEDVLRSLACSLGAGGYNALTVDPAVFEQKIRWGIDQLTRPAQAEPDHVEDMRAMAEPAPAQTEQEIIGVDRYRVEPTGRGFWPFCVRAGSGERELFIGHRKTCEQVAAELATAFEDGKFVAALPAQTEQQPGQSEELAWKVLEAATDALDRRAAPHVWISQAWDAGSEVITSRRGRTEPWPAS